MKRHRTTHKVTQMLRKFLEFLGKIKKKKRKRERKRGVEEENQRKEEKVIYF